MGIAELKWLVQGQKTKMEETFLVGNIYVLLDNCILIALYYFI